MIKREAEHKARPQIDEQTPHVMRGLFFLAGEGSMKFRVQRVILFPSLP